MACEKVWQGTASLELSTFFIVDFGQRASLELYCCKGISTSLLPLPLALPHP